MRRRRFRPIRWAVPSVKPVYGPADAEGRDYSRDIAEPGDFPYTRGIHQTGYRGKVFTMRQFAGFGLAAQTNQRYKQLLSSGQTGLSVAFDMPTLMGHAWTRRNR